MSKEIYVLVCERDLPIGSYPDDDPRPLVMEQYIDGDHASLDSAKSFRDRLGGRYGNVWIARLEFVDDGEPKNDIGRG